MVGIAGQDGEGMPTLHNPPQRDLGSRHVAFACHAQHRLVIEHRLATMGAAQRRVRLDGDAVCVPVRNGLRIVLGDVVLDP